MLLSTVTTTVFKAGSASFGLMSPISEIAAALLLQ